MHVHQIYGYIFLSLEKPHQLQDPGAALMKPHWEPTGWSHVDIRDIYKDEELIYDSKLVVYNYLSRITLIFTNHSNRWLRQKNEPHFWTEKILYIRLPWKNTIRDSILDFLEETLQGLNGSFIIPRPNSISPMKQLFIYCFVCSKITGVIP